MSCIIASHGMDAVNGGYRVTLNCDGSICLSMWTVITLELCFRIAGQLRCIQHSVKFTVPTATFTSCFPPDLEDAADIESARLIVTDDMSSTVVEYQPKD
jgi:hypothetical protein